MTTWQGGNNQSAPPHHTNFQFNPTYFRSNLCGQNEPHRETPQRAQKIERTKGQNTRGARGCGEQEKVNGRRVFFRKHDPCWVSELNLHVNITMLHCTRFALELHFS